MRRHTQQSLLLYNLQLPVGLECMARLYPPLDWWWVQALFCTLGTTKKEETGSMKRGSQQG